MENNREKDTFLLENLLVKNNFKIEEFEFGEGEGEEIDEYVVTVYHHEDLESFYDDMETPGGTDHVPDRCVECCNRRPISRNTHYHLSQKEIKTLKQDDRVWDIVPKKLLDSAITHPTGWTENSFNWDKSSSKASTHRNWGLRRCIDGTQTSNWGYDFYSNEGTANITGSVTATSSGKNVDVVIVDGFINPNHPEMAVNYDGSGGTRVVQFNWYSLNPSVTGGTAGTYPYPATYVAYGDDHGMHVGGTAAGNSQGWARGANVFNFYVYGASSVAFDYVREFHKQKAVNPATGLKNPTIMNNSWGSSFPIAKNKIISIIWRGDEYAPSTGDWTQFGANVFDSFGLTDQTATQVRVRLYTTVMEADVQDAINNGVIVVGAAGNEYTKIDVPGGIDYDNLILFNLGGQVAGLFYHRGSSASSAGTLAAGSICVGAISTLVNESKADFSNSGPRVTIYAPGTQIMSSYHSGTTDDFRSASFKINKIGGTSMASPQVCGVLACALEQYPRMTQAEAIQYIQSFATLNQITNTSGGYADNTDLQGSGNRYLFYKKDRKESGVLQPRDATKTRPTSGQAYPRRLTLHYKK